MKTLARLAMVSIASIATYSPTWAQTQAPSAAPAALDEIVVTAEKREESINDVPMAVSAFSGSQLVALGIKNVQDLTEVVPGLTFAQTNFSTPVYTLRGVGFYETSLSAYPDVTVYVDEAALPFPILTTHVGFDLDRVEVLRGPQGILFGQNSTGGAINYVAAKPTSTFQAGTYVSYGEFNAFDLQGYVSGPINDTLSARLAVDLQQGGAYQYSYTRNYDNTLGNRNVLAGRFMVDWKPLEQLKVEFTANASSDNSQQLAPQLSALAIQFPALPPAGLTTYPVAPANDRAADWSPDINPPHVDQNQQNAALRIDYGLSNDLHVTALTAYAHFTRYDTIEGDATSLNATDVAPAQGNIQSISQELRLANSNTSPLRWLVGGNYENDRVNEFYRYLIGDTSGTAQVFGLLDNNVSSSNQMTNYAAFANTEWDFAQNFTLRAGARYTKADRSYNGCSSDSGDDDGKYAALFAGVSGALRGVPPPVIPPHTCVTLDAVSFLPGPVIGTLNQDNVSWRGGLDWKPLPDTLLYGFVAKGYKAGSFPTLSAATSAQYRPVTQESLLDYELGVKSTLIDRVLTMNGGIFYYDYTNKQLLSKFIDPIFGVLGGLVNVPKSNVKGVEWSADLRPFTGAGLNVSATYLDAKVTDFNGINNAGQKADFAGAAIPYTPKWQISTDATYQWPIGNLTALLGANTIFHTLTNAAVGSDPAFKIDSYWVLNLRASLATAEDRWRFSVYGNNVANRYYWTNVVQGFDTVFRYAGIPGTYGVSAEYRFK